MRLRFRSIGGGSAYAKNEFAVSSHPSILQGYVKCSVRGTDTVSINVQILKSGVVVDNGQWTNTTSINNWTVVNIPISQYATQADSAIITFRGGKYFDSSTTYDNGTRFWVDYFTLLK
ncbi:MAG: hypothetical protein ACYDCN_00275 [Bacteroidia bacterium]